MVPLAPYPSTQTCKFLSPVQAASLYETIAKALQITLSLSQSENQVPASSSFVASYARNAAQQVFDSLIWDAEIKLSPNERRIRKLTLQLAGSLASSTSLAIDLQTLVSLSVAFARTHIKRIRSIIHSALAANRQLAQDVDKDLVPSFTVLLSVNQSSPSHGLYAIRKTAHSLLSFIRVSPPEFVRSFAYNKEFVLALANMYDDGMAAIAAGYGGIHVLRNAIATDPGATPRDPDSWERIWVSTKVALIDAFHTILSCILDDLASTSGQQLASTSERALNVIFALLELRPSSSQQIQLTPFLNLPLVADYQRTYNLSRTLEQALHHAEDKDPRLDIVESTLQAFDNQPADDHASLKGPGALTLLLRSSSLPRTVAPSSATDTLAKGKNRETSRSHIDVANVDTDLDIRVTQVLDIFPSHSPSYIRLLLGWPGYSGSAESVIEALLEGTAPEESELLSAIGNGNTADTGPVEDDITRIVRERRNIFDGEVMDLSKLRIGKKNEENTLGDKAYIERMKIDILRRVQEMEIEDEEDEDLGILSSAAAASAKSKGKAAESIETDEDDLEDLRRVKVVGDGESDSESDETNDEEEESEKTSSLETMLELAYIRDPKLFDRDAATRRSKARADLKAQTGWGDEQIEGWRIMLERHPKKDKILQKHEFSGNQHWLPPPRDVAAGSSAGNGSRGSGDRSRGRGRGGSQRGRGGGRGDGRGPSESGSGAANVGDESARGRAFKGRHKARGANHNRKRGHDKKMARAGAGGPSNS